MLDISGSMSNPSDPNSSDMKIPTKLQLVENTIMRLAEKCPENVEHILIPYTDELHKIRRFNNVKELGEAIQGLTPWGNTDIGLPIDKALALIKKTPKNTEGIEYRNLINLISDGQADSERPLKLASQYEAHNAAAFSLGVGTGYKEDLMHGIFKNSGFGGFAHIPQTGKDKPIDVFGKILPEFMSQIISAPYYPIITLSRWFHSVINMTPSTREANLADDYSCWQAAIGYQNRGFVVGFIDESDLNKAEIKLKLKESASAKTPLKTEEIVIEDFDSLGLDPSDIELLHQAPLDALKMQILKERKPENIREFLENNAYVDEAFRKQLEDLATKLEKYARHGDENASRTVTSDASASFTQATMMHSNPFVSAIVNPPSYNGDTISGNREAGTVKEPSVFFPKDLSATGPIGKSNPSSQAITFTFIPINSSIKMGANEFSIEPGQELSFGRSSSNNIVLKGSDYISKNHGNFILNNGKLYIRDSGSRNGIKLNGSKINPIELYEIKPTDIIDIADNKFSISF